MPVPTEVLDLVERYDRNRDAYRSGRYNEAQVRREFIDPFFMALGWDVENRAGHGEAYKDVVHEDLVKVGELAAARTPGDKAALERQIAALDGQIDRLVYELYDLTEEEIRIAEQGTPR